MPVMLWLVYPVSLIVEVVISSEVPEPPVPDVGTGSGTLVDGTGPMTGCAYRYDDIRRDRRTDRRAAAVIRRDHVAVGASVIGDAARRAVGLRRGTESNLELRVAEPIIGAHPTGSNRRDTERPEAESRDRRWWCHGSKPGRRQRKRWGLWCNRSSWAD